MKSVSIKEELLNKHLNALLKWHQLSVDNSYIKTKELTILFSKNYISRATLFHAKKVLAIDTNNRLIEKPTAESAAKLILQMREYCRTNNHKRQKANTHQENTDLYKTIIKATRALKKQERQNQTTKTENTLFNSKDGSQNTRTDIHTKKEQNTASNGFDALLLKTTLYAMLKEIQNINTKLETIIQIWNK